MNLRVLLAIVAACFTLVLNAAPAQAQATRTWVSGVGDDLNPCSRTAPCKTFSGALSKTLAGGEINCLDPGGYGTVNITKSITIDCDGTLGSILASSTTGVIVNGAGIIVVLRNLTINGGAPTAPGTFGVRVLQGAQVNIENVRIQSFRAASPNGFGVTVLPSSGTTTVYITDSIISGNGAAASGGGINVAPTGTGSVALFLNGVELNNNRVGVTFTTTGTTSSASALSMQRTTLFRNLGGGIIMNSGANASQAMLDDVTLDANGTSISLAGAGVTMRLGDSVVSFNGTAVTLAGGATIQSYKDNQIDLNSNNSTPITQVFPQ